MKENSKKDLKDPKKGRKKYPKITVEPSLLESNKIEGGIVNETPIVYDTPYCENPNAGCLDPSVKKEPKLSWWERFVDFICNL